MVVPALCRAAYGGAIDTRRAVDALRAAMDVRRARSGPFSGERYASCGLDHDGCVRSARNCDAPDRGGSDPNEEFVEGKRGAGNTGEAAWATCDLCSLYRAQST